MPEPLPSIHQVFSLNTSLHPSIMLVWLRSSKPPGPRHVWNKLASKPRFLKIRGPKYMKAFLVQGGQVNKQKNTTRKPADTEIWESVPLKKWYTGFIYIGMSCNWTNQTRHTYIYDDQHFLPLNIENEIASFKPTLWSVLPSLFFFLESDHFCGFVYEGIYNLIVWDAGPSRLQRSWSIGIGPQVCLSYTGLNQRENALFYEQNLYLPLIDVCSTLSDCWFHCTLYLSPKKAAWLWYPSPLKLPKILISSSNSIGWCYSVVPKKFRCTLQIPILPPFRKHHIYGSGEFSIRIFSGSCLEYRGCNTHRLGMSHGKSHF